MVLRTEMHTETGVVALTDYLPLHPDDKHNDIGLHSRAGIHRILEGIDGEVEIDVELAARPEYGLTTPLLHETEPGVWATRGGPITVTIVADVPLESSEGVLRARATVRAGDRIGFALCASDPWHDPPPEVVDVFQSLDDTTYGYFNKVIGSSGDPVTGALSLSLTHASNSYGVTFTVPKISLSKYSDDAKLTDVIVSSLEINRRSRLSRGRSISLCGPKTTGSR